jgi:CheY-like chemotaxis protein
MEFEIIIVDDKDIDLMLLNRIVKKVFPHHTAKEYLSGTTALEHIYEDPSMRKLILVLLDINMPEFSGWEFLDVLANNPIDKQVKVCIVTSSVNISDKRKAEKYPNIIGFLEKPITVGDLENLKKEIEDISYWNG